MFLGGLEYRFVRPHGAQFYYAQILLWHFAFCILHFHLLKCLRGIRLDHYQIHQVVHGALTPQAPVHFQVSPERYLLLSPVVPRHYQNLPPVLSQVHRIKH